MRHSRQRFIAGVTAAYAGLIGPRYAAGAAEFSYKLGALNPLGFPPVAHAAQAAQKVLDESGGRFEIKVFPQNQLGGNTDMLSQIRIGALEMYLVDDGTLATVVPVVAMGNLPFIVSNVQEGFKILTGQFGELVHRSLANVGVYNLPSAWYVGFRDLANSVRPVHEPPDVRGLKIRTTGSPVDVGMWKALGASPSVVSTSEQYTALQTHVIDGTAASLPGFEGAKLQEVCKYASITHHSWNAINLVANAQAWQKLPPNLRDLAEHQFELARQGANDEIVKSDSTVLDRLRVLGMTINQVDRPAFKKAIHVAGLYDSWKALFGAQSWSALEATIGRIS